MVTSERIHSHPVYDYLMFLYHIDQNLKYLDSVLASLLLNKNNKADLNGIFNIPQYPLRIHFKNLVNNIDDIKEISSNWVKSQSIINSEKKIKFFKTHQINYQGNNFTNIENIL